MTRLSRIEHRFVEFIPREIEPGTLYITVEYATAIHACACGCGERVVTPLSPADWRLMFDGETVSLWPSIGNWGFVCESHYWIRRNVIEWAGRWSEAEIDAGRARDRAVRATWWEEARDPRDGVPGDPTVRPRSAGRGGKAWLRLPWRRR